MGYFWVDNSFLTFLDHFGDVWYPYPCPKWLDFSPIPAKAIIPNLRPNLLCNTTNMGYFLGGKWQLIFGIFGHFKNILYFYPLYLTCLGCILGVSFRATKNKQFNRINSADFNTIS